MKIAKTLGAVTLAFMAAAPATDALAEDSRTIGEVDTVWNLIGPADKIIVTGFNDPEINGITCHISRPVKGGIMGGLGFAEEKSDASIACRQTGPISFTSDIAADTRGEEVFNESRSVWFKQLHVTRFFDQASNTVVYLTWTDKLIDGSPKNSISTVPLWETNVTVPIVGAPQ